jgi:PPP family 3-phenylpropionic acid transporter
MRITVVRLIRSPNNPLRAAYVFGFASLSSWMPIFNIWLEDCGLTGTRIGYIAAIPWITMLIVQPLWGILADKYGKLRIFRIAVITATLLFALFPLAGKGIIPVALMTLALALFNNPVLPLLDSIALDHIEGKHHISYSNIRFWGAPGYGLGAVVTGWLIPAFGVRVSFFTAAAFLVLALLALLRFAPAKEKGRGIDLEFKNLAQILPDKLLLGFLLVIVIVSIGQSAISFYLGVYMREIGATPRIIGTTIGVQAFSELPFYFIAAWLLTRMKPGIVVMIAIIATSVRLFFYSINSNPHLVIFIETMNGMTWTLLWIASVEYVNSIIPARWRTTGQSLLWAAYFGAGAILGNVISGRLYESMPMQRVYAINSLMVVAVVVLVIIAVLINHLRSNSRLVKE